MQAEPWLLPRKQLKLDQEGKTGWEINGVQNITEHQKQS